MVAKGPVTAGSHLLLSNEEQYSHDSGLEVVCVFEDSQGQGLELTNKIPCSPLLRTWWGTGSPTWTRLGTVGWSQLRWWWRISTGTLRDLGKKEPIKVFGREGLLML